MAPRDRGLVTKNTLKRAQAKADAQREVSRGRPHSYSASEDEEIQPSQRYFTPHAEYNLLYLRHVHVPTTITFFTNQAFSTIQKVKWN